MPTLFFRYSGDIVIARSPTNPHCYICKRVTAVEGQAVEFKGNGLDISMVMS